MVNIWLMKLFKVFPWISYRSFTVFQFHFIGYTDYMLYWIYFKYACMQGFVSVTMVWYFVVLYSLLQYWSTAVLLVSWWQCLTTLSRTTTTRCTGTTEHRWGTRTVHSSHQSTAHTTHTPQPAEHAWTHKVVNEFILPYYMYMLCHLYERSRSCVSFLKLIYVNSLYPD